MKSHFALILGTALIGASVPAYGLVNLGEVGRIDLTTAGSVSWDSEIRSRNAGEEDMIYTLDNTLTYSKSSRLFDLRASVGLLIRRYGEFDQYDDENISLNLNFSPSQGTELRTSSITVSGDLILKTSTEVDEELGEIISRQTYGLSLGVLYDPNSHYNLRFRASAIREDPDSSRYPQRDRTNFGATLEIPVNAETSMEFGTDYAKTESDETLNTQGETITGFAGLSGRLLPKVSGFARAGFQYQETSDLGSESSPYASVGLNWSIDESTSAAISLSQSLYSTFDDRKTETTSATVTLRRSLNRRLSASASIRYRESDIIGLNQQARTTESVNLSTGLVYALNEFTSVDGTITYWDSTSNDNLFEFDRLRVGISVRARW